MDPWTAPTIPLSPEAELERRLAVLRALRAEGTLEYEAAGVRQVFARDAELAAAIADLERQIAVLRGAPVSTILVASSKGLE